MLDGVSIRFLDRTELTGVLYQHGNEQQRWDVVCKRVTVLVSHPTFCDHLSIFVLKLLLVLFDDRLR